jgi:hydrogenase maturation protein HypF
MNCTFHIHINGLVQGVGFRPHVYKIAVGMNLYGWVCNDMNGVDIHINCEKITAEKFLKKIIKEAPKNSKIVDYSLESTNFIEYQSFSIKKSINTYSIPDIFITPDFSICPECQTDILSDNNRRNNYPFTTCTVCGPRYSIINSLPFDREHTTMMDFSMCSSCEKEYENISDKRYFSQTNSCPNCAIQLQLFNKEGNSILNDNNDIVKNVAQLLTMGKILALKNTGGYLLLCKANETSSIQLIRERKKRISKPFAVLFKNIEAAKMVVTINDNEKTALESPIAPIVLCKIRNQTTTIVDIKNVAPGLDKIGVMLPNSALLFSLFQYIDFPVIATSANISGAPIIYKDEEALSNLFDFADYIVSYNREIVTPQDDSLIQFTNFGQQIILRRSRGMAPNFFDAPEYKYRESLLCTGADMKSAFSIFHQNKIYVSQFLGNQSSFEAQSSFQNTLAHMQSILQTKIKGIIIDKHPKYFSSLFGVNLANEKKINITTVQHHEAHLMSVIGEHNLFEKSILGFIWDGTGYGHDGQIWGSECFQYSNTIIDRKYHLKYFPNLLGDKMANEPRISALSVLSTMQASNLLEAKFNEQEWNFFNKVLNQKDNVVFTCSMGRFIDAIASIVLSIDINRYEGEAAMLLEVAARKAITHNLHYDFEIGDIEIHYEKLIIEMLYDIQINKDTSFIALKFMNSLANLIYDLVIINNEDSIILSGGVFQNSLLNELIHFKLENKIKIYRNKQLSPNDENISFGQLMHFRQFEKKFKNQIENINSNTL